ncbi:MAG TPA: hypothetical protein PLJ84_12705 [Bacteroidales bacterium]|jgi:hypothetical protein|nr:hypothetical protein [Bacteroidales bacterium]
MSGLSYEFWGLVVSIAGVIITIVKMWITASEKLAQHKQFVVTSLAVQEKMILENQARIDENRLAAVKEVEQIKRDRADRVAAVYNEIESIKKLREMDVKELTVSLRDSIEKTTAIEEKHHAEVILKIEALTVQLTDMCSTFKEYRRTHNGNGKKGGYDAEV